MTSRKTIMVESPVWDKTDKFKHRICVRSIGDAITEAIDIATSKEYYAGIHQYEDGRFRIESLGRTEGEAIRNLIKLYEYLEEDAPQERDIYVSSEYPKNEDCFFTCLCYSAVYYEYMQYLGVECWKSDDDCFNIPLDLFRNEDGELIVDTPMILGHWNHNIVIVDTRNNAIVGHGFSYIDAWASYEADENKEVDDLSNLTICSASNELYAEVLKYGEHRRWNLYCELFSPEKGGGHFHDAFTAGNDEYWAVVEVVKNYGLVHGVGCSGNEAINNSICEMKDSGKNILVSWDARNYHEWVRVPLNKEDDDYVYGRHEPMSENPFIVIQCSKEFYRQAILSEKLEKGMKCKICGEVGSRTADIWKKE